MKAPLDHRLTPFFAAAALVLSACSSDDDSMTQPPPVPASITAALDGLGLTSLESLLVSAGLDDDLAAPGSLTLFAPTNAAFAALEPAVLTALQNNQALLEDALQYHVLTSDVPSSTAVTLSSTPALNGDTLEIDAVNGGLYINDARVVDADNVTQNGRIHIIDRVLLPPAMDLSTALGERGFDNLIAAVGASSLSPDGMPLTVFAPTDAAFETFATDNGATDFADFLATAMQADVDALLSNHLLGGVDNKLGTILTAGDLASVGGQRLFFGDTAMAAPTVNGLVLSGFNAPAGDALIHTVDSVITDPGDVLQVATDAGLTTLVDNVDNASLTATLQGAGPFTVFAPSEAAWTASELTDLQAPGNEADLATVLTYHVLGDAIQAAELVGLSSVTTVETSTVQISVDGQGNVTLDTNPGQPDNVTANVVATNVFANNAVVHVIDQVLLPPNFVLP